MTIEDEVKLLQLQIRRLETKVFLSQDLDISNDVKKLMSAREQSENISKDVADEHFIGVRSKKAAEEKINSFKNQYDEGAVNSLHGNEVDRYLHELELVNVLATKFNLPKVENLRK